LTKLFDSVAKLDFYFKVSRHLTIKLFDSIAKLEFKNIFLFVGFSSFDYKAV
jgi:hypothetical protein